MLCGSPLAKDEPHDLVLGPRGQSLSFFVSDLRCAIRWLKMRLRADLHRSDEKSQNLGLFDPHAFHPQRNLPLAAWYVMEAFDAVT